MYNLNRIIVIVFNCTRVYAQGYTVVMWMEEAPIFFTKPKKKHIDTKIFNCPTREITLVIFCSFEKQ